MPPGNWMLRSYDGAKVKFLVSFSKRFFQTAPGKPKRSALEALKNGEGGIVFLNQLQLKRSYPSVQTYYISGFSQYSRINHNSLAERETRDDEDRYEGSHYSEISLSSYLASLFGVVVSIFAWHQFKGTVQAAKPFYDYEPKSDGPVVDVGKNINEPPKSPERNASTIRSSGSKSPPPPGRRQMFNFVADVVSEVGHAVVCIDVKDHSTIDWFSGTPRTVSNGSGFIIKEDGLILTNAHVVLGKSRSSLTVRLPDGRCFSGHVEDVDIESDLATVRIKSRGLPVMPLGSSADTRIGEWVVAIGSPLSLTNTVTCGVVSNVDRSLNELGYNNRNTAYIQTDASINCGNSGGPLVNLDGEAIGINSMKVTAGISFAIPIDNVKEFLAKCEARKKSGSAKPVRRYIGATLLTLTDEIAAELGFSGPTKCTEGVLVYKLVVGSPAYLAHLQPGDVIVAVNDEPTKTVQDVFRILLTADVLKMVVRRRDQSFQCIVTPETVH